MQPLSPTPIAKAPNIRKTAKKDRRPRFKPTRNSGHRQARAKPACQLELVFADAVVADIVVTVRATGTVVVPLVNVTDDCDKLQVPGEGSPEEQDRSIVPVNPEKAFTLMENVSVCPDGAFALMALLETPKPDTSRFRVPVFEPLEPR